MTTNQMIRQLRALKKSILADGEVDWDETEQLRKAIRPLSVRRGFIFEDYERLLMKCRKDMKITPDESKELAHQLDLMCSMCAKQRLTFWLSIVLVGLLVTASLAMIYGIASATDTNALRHPATDQAVPQAE